jgi:hypothetical protein
MKNGAKWRRFFAFLSGGQGDGGMNGFSVRPVTDGQAGCGSSGIPALMDPDGKDGLLHFVRNDDGIGATVAD